MCKPDMSRQSVLTLKVRLDALPLYEHEGVRLQPGALLTQTHSSHSQAYWQTMTSLSCWLLLLLLTDPYLGT